MNSQIEIRSISKLKTAPANGRKYFTITFGKVMAPGVTFDNTPTKTRNIWETFTDKKTKQTFKGDAMFDQIVILDDAEKAIGGIVPGDIASAETDEEYPIGDRMVKTWSGVVFAHEQVKALAESAAKRARLLADAPVAPKRK